MTWSSLGIAIAIGLRVIGLGIGLLIALVITLMVIDRAIFAVSRRVRVYKAAQRRRAHTHGGKDQK